MTGMNNPPSAQTLMVRPVSTITLTFDGKSEKFEFFEDLFRTMIKIQSDMTEAMKTNHFHSLLRKNALKTFCKINTANRKHWRTFCPYFAGNTSNLSPRRPPDTNGTDWCLTQTPWNCPISSKNWTQGAEKGFGETVASSMPNCRPNWNAQSMWLDSKTPPMRK